MESNSKKLKGLSTINLSSMNTELTMIMITHRETNPKLCNKVISKKKEILIS